MLSIIVARARNGAIGKANTIPWHAPEDLSFFRRETLGGAVIMGRRTWESLPPAARPLKNRDNIVVSSTQQDGVDTVPSFDEAMQLARAQGHQRIYAIGGSSIYRAALPRAHRLLITEVDLVIEEADAFFPSLDEREWTLGGTQVLREEGPRCVLRELLRQM